MTQDKGSKDKLSKLRGRAEWAVARKSLDVSAVSALSREKAQELIHELQVHQIELELQNEELRQTQLALQSSLDKYSELYDFAPIGYFTLDQNGVILEANLTGASLLGIERSLLIGKPFSVFVDKDYGDAVYLHFRQVLETQSKQTCDAQIRKQDGNQVYLILVSQPLRSQDGSPTRLRTAVIDITKRKEDQSELKEGE